MEDGKLCDKLYKTQKKYQNLVSNNLLATYKDISQYI